MNLINNFYSDIIPVIKHGVGMGQRENAIPYFHYLFFNKMVIGNRTYYRKIFIKIQFYYCFVSCFCLPLLSVGLVFPLYF